MPLLFALLLGVVSALSFQPVGLWPLMPLAFAGLCELVVRAKSLKRALLVGWGFGVGQFVLGLNWIATAFTYQAAMPAWLGWIAVVLLSLYLAVFPMLAAGLGWRFGRNHCLALVLALGGAWAITEWLRAKVFTGFAWNPVGVTLVDTPWRETSATIGTYGLSALVVLAGGMMWLLARRQWKAPLAFAAALALMLALPDPRTFDQHENLRTFDLPENAPALTAINPEYRSRTPVQAVVPPPAPPVPGRTPPSNDAQPVPPAPLPAPPAYANPPPPAPLTPHSAVQTGIVRIVQPNIGQADKWRDGFEVVAARRLENLSTRPYRDNASPADTIFWPEAAVTSPLVDERAAAASSIASERMRAARSLVPGQLLATGGLAITSSNGRTVDGATNSVFVLDSGGTIVGRYDKAHLVPYGEYLPMRPILSAIGLSRLAPGDLDFRPGPGPRTLALPNGLKMGVQLCYEIIFSGEVVDPARRPDYIFNPSNDAWFGAWGPPQHLAQARLRAAEEGLPIVRSTPTGISAMIDASGRLVRSIPAGPARSIDTALPIEAPPTPFARLGNLIPLVLGFLLLISAIALAPRRR